MYMNVNINIKRYNVNYLIIVKLTELLLWGIISGLWLYWFGVKIEFLLINKRTIFFASGVDFLIDFGDLQFGLNKAFEFPTLPGRECIDVYFNFILRNVLTLADNFADDPQMFRRELAYVLAELSFLLDGHRLVHLHSRVGFEAGLRPFGLMQILQFSRQAVHSLLKLVDVHVLVALHLLESLLEIVTQFQCHHVDVARRRVVNHRVVPNLAHVYSELYKATIHAFFYILLNCR